MGLQREHGNQQPLTDPYYGNDSDDPKLLNHQKQVRRLVEERLEQRRLKAELEEEWDNTYDDLP